MSVDHPPPPPAPPGLGETDAPGPAPVGGGPPWLRPVIGALIVAVGVAWFADAAGWVDLRWQAALPAALVVLGVVTVAVSRRQHPGALVPLGVVLVIAVVVVSLLPARLSASVGERFEAPATAGELRRDYTLGAGSLTVDLRVLELDSHERVRASVGVGELVVRLPPEIPLARVEAAAGIGEVEVLDRRRSGFGPELSDRFEVDGPASLSLDLSVGIGRIEVSR